MMEDISVQDTVAFLAGIAVVLGGVFLAADRAKKWIKQTVGAKLTKMEDQLVPNGGRTESTRHLIEDIHGTLGEMKTRIAENREIATRAEIKADTALSLIQDRMHHSD
jgi:hypothetical protein